MSKAITVAECTLCGFPVTPETVRSYCAQCRVTQAKLLKSEIVK